MQTDTPVLNEEICCWIYNINNSKLHHPMAMRVRSGTPAICMAMEPPFEFTVCVCPNLYGIVKTEICINSLLSSF